MITRRSIAEYMLEHSTRGRRSIKINTKMALGVLQLLLPVLTSGFVFATQNTLGSFDMIEALTKELKMYLLERQTPYPMEDMMWLARPKVGQISGISVDPTGHPVIFHRAERVWNYDTFDENFEYTEASRGPIQDDTILTLNPVTGDVVDGWGRQIFYLPHGLHIDPNGNYWVTDVALHQVFKFQHKSMEPELVLGERFVPGNDRDHFCQPTSVAVARTGEIVVTDGYCNNRIMIFDSSGNLLNRIPHQGAFMALRVPHGVTILEQGDVCVADRENMRVICMNAGLGGNDSRCGPPLTMQQPDLGRVFAISSYGNTVYAVNGPTSPLRPIQGFVMDPETETIFRHWKPKSGSFTNPHGMAISPNGTELYVSEIGPNRVWKFNLVSPYKIRKQQFRDENTIEK